ncbi:uncharacterized protein LOC127115460 [Lathyrus oleraceus]|uniref:DUF1639 family protein n=1 Tax=Pisum sativum TaxID=3888 RepID=A0A9D4YNC8_PEA|nr:uncharacterized protein LOC127115460 [Pisum sativum]KAI5441708.1 hypothetical protein KIW84_010959 [Pisum sativum]
MEPERSKPLHNFSLPPMKWGTQRLLRCVNPPDPSPLNRNSPQSDPNRKNHETVVRERIMGDLTVAATKLQVSIFEENADAHASLVVGASNASAIRPWNLRTRRAACKAPPSPSPIPPPPPRDEGRRFFDVGSSSPSPVMMMKKKKTVMVNEKVKFSVSLSKEEVEQDFWALAGTRPPRRPKKRPRIVQRQLNTLLPGMWLSEVTAESYKVSEVPE